MEEGKKQRKAGKLQIALILFSVVFLVFYLYREEGIYAVPLLFRWDYALMLFLASLCIVISWLAEAAVLYVTMRSAPVRIRYGTAVRICMIGLYFNTVTPLATGGQPSQAYQLHKRGISYAEAVSGLFSKFLTYQVTYTIYCAVVLLMRFSSLRASLGNLVYMALAGFAMQIVVTLGLLSMAFFKRGTTRAALLLLAAGAKLRILKKPEEKKEKLLEEIDAFHERSREVFRHKRRLLVSFAMTLVQLSAFYTVGYVLYRCFARDGGTDFFTVISSQVFITLISSVVPLPGAVGAAEGSFYYFFQMYFPSSVLSLVMILWRFLTFYLPLFVGLLMTISWKSGKKRQR